MHFIFQKCTYWKFYLRKYFFRNTPTHVFPKYTDVNKPYDASMLTNSCWFTSKMVISHIQTHTSLITKHLWSVWPKIPNRQNNFWPQKNSFSYLNHRRLLQSRAQNGRWRVGWTSPNTSVANCLWLKRFSLGAFFGMPPHAVHPHMTLHVIQI